MEPPRINPVGLLETSEDFAASPRRFSRPLRLFAGALLALFLAATVVSSVVSLGRYCLTTDAADVRALRTIGR
ncbi:MAG TPA: hypothetical protein VIA62_05335 [Thermoanaerobaculia bacterium]|jgi:hypothetical protein|nr:hypothetical protein [Thermoanaerobaculia bacterium]